MKNILTLILVFCLYNVTEVRSYGVGSSEQTWSYVTVREGAHYFWWLYYASSGESTWENKPLLITLTTRMLKGASGTDNFAQIGPLDIDLNPRNDTWLNNFNILFVDNILECGFSYVDNEANYPATSDQMGEDTFEVIKHFFSKVPEFKTVPTYMMTQNIGTVIAAKTALIWAQAQKKKQVESNFKAVVLGAPWISIFDVVSFWTKPLNKDKFSKEEFETIEDTAIEAKKAMEQENYWDLFLAFSTQISSIQTYWKLNNIYNLSPNVTTNYFDFVKDTKLEDLMNSHVKNVLKLDHKWKSEVDGAVMKDFGEKAVKPIKDTFDQLLETDVKVIIIAGQNDLVIPAPSVYSWVKNFNWANKEAFQETKHLRIDDGILVKKYGNLEYYLIEAGHLLMVDNPQDLKKIIIKVTQE